MTREQIVNVCRHHGLIEWVDPFSRLVNDSKIEDREFGRLVRKSPRFIACLEMLEDVVCADSTRQLFDHRPDFIRETERAEQIANGNLS